MESPAIGFFLAPGLGKTSIILSMVAILLKKRFIKSVLVVASRRIIYNVWPMEIKKWGFPLTVSIVHGTPKQRLEALRTKADVYLTNYENLEWLQKNHKQFNQRPDMLVLDESSKVKNPRSLRFKVLKKMIKDKWFKRRYILTGSPVPNGMLDIWSQIFLLDGGAALGQFITAFRNRYFYPSGFMGYDFKLQEGAEERILEAVEPLIVRFSDAELNLKKPLIVDRFIDLPTEARKFYDELEREFIAEWKGGIVTAANAAVATGKMHQAANGGLYAVEASTELKRLVRGKVDVYGVDELKRKTRKVIDLHDEKTADLQELVEELNGAPLLVAYEFMHDLARIKKVFPDAPHIGGGVSDKEAGRIIEAFDAGEVPVLLAHPQSVAHGLNLQASCSYVAFYSLTWNLENYEQLIRRVWRQGQTRSVIVYRLIAAGTVDEVMAATLEAKDTRQTRVLKALEERYGRRK